MTEKSTRKPLYARFEAWAEAMEMTPSERIETRIKVLEHRMDALEHGAERSTRHPHE